MWTIRAVALRVNPIPAIWTLSALSNRAEFVSRTRVAKIMVFACTVVVAETPGREVYLLDFRVKRYLDEQGIGHWPLHMP